MVGTPLHLESERTGGGATIATPAMLLFGTTLKGHGSGLRSSGLRRSGLAGSARRAPELSILAPVGPGSTLLNAIPDGPPLLGPLPPSTARRPASTLLSQAGETAPGSVAPSAPDSAAPGSAAGAAAGASAMAMRGCSHAGGGAGAPGSVSRTLLGAAGRGPTALPLLLLSPPINMPPSSLLPLAPPPMSGRREGASPGSAATAVAALDDADRVLSQPFKPSSARLTDLFKASLPDCSGDGDAGTDRGVTGTNALGPKRSPRTATELREALRELAAASPEQKDLLPPMLGLPMAPPPLGAATVGAAAMAGAHGGMCGGAAGAGLSLLEVEAVEAALSSGPPAGKHRLTASGADGTLPSWLDIYSSPLGSGGAISDFLHCLAASSSGKDPLALLQAAVGDGQSLYALAERMAGVPAAAAH